jgi:hypothetical protein
MLKNGLSSLVSFLYGFIYSKSRGDIAFRFHFEKLAGIFCAFSIVLGLGFAGCSANEECLEDSFDYNPYLRKIWVVEDWTGGAHNYHLSFFITDIENGEIKGKFLMGGVANSCVLIPSSPRLGDFSGTVYNGVAKCVFMCDTEGYDSFPEEGGYRGSATFTFNEENMIEVHIEYAKSMNEVAFNNGAYLYRPYKFADIMRTDMGWSLKEKSSFSIDLDCWGTVNFVTGVVLMNEYDRQFPIAALTDDSDNVLCNFREGYYTSGKMIGVMIEDFNGDGMKDVKITMIPVDFETGDTVTDPEEYIEYVYYQMNDGWFSYSSPYVDL